ncbi:fused MFS/spermidine synthase [Kaarinaea lacus]
MPNKSYLYILLAIYSMSGLTALAYEVLWVRMLALQFGVSIFGVVVTVSTFMAGLGIGSVMGLNWSRRILAPLKWFAAFEFCIALLALITPWLLLSSENLLASIAAQSSLMLWYLMQFVLVSVLLFVPAFCMGAGFPMMLKSLGDSPQTLAKAYGVNTLGAAGGALFPLLLLPKLGWLSSMQTVALIGVLVAGIAIYLSMRFEDNKRVMQSLPPVGVMPDLLTLVAYSGIGAAALMLEVAWTRMFGMIMLRTEYVLALVLAMYLIGVGLGSLLSRFMRSDLWYMVLPVVVCAYVIAGLWMLPHLLPWVRLDSANSLLMVTMRQIVVLSLLTFPVTVLLGAWLPLLNKLFGGSHISGAWLYGANSVGAAGGALLAGFVLTPLVGSAATMVIAALTLLILGLTWGRFRYAWVSLPVLAVVAYPVSSMPSVAQLLPNLYSNSSELYFHEDAVSITHVIEQPSGQRILLADLQRMDASSDPTSVEAQKNQARLPLLLHPEPKSILLLGLGTGISAAGTLAYPQLQRTAVELSQGAIQAARHWFTPVNGNVMGQLDVVRDDARHFLMASHQRFDVIVGDLFHPDLVGRSALLSVQQFARAKRRLSDDGVFVQWLALNQFTVDAFETVVRSFQQEFPQSVIFVDAFRVALVGTNADTTDFFSGSVLAKLSQLDEAQLHMATGGEGVWTWLGRYWGTLPMAEGKVQDEWAPRIEFDLPRARYSGQLDLAVILNYLLQRRPSVEQALNQLRVAPEHARRFENAFKATELAHKSWLAFLTGQGTKVEKTLQLAYQTNPKDRWIGFAVADGALASLDSIGNRQYDEWQVLQSVLKVRPDHPEALLRLWRLAQVRGDANSAADFRARFAAVDPLSKALEKPQ